MITQSYSPFDLHVLATPPALVLSQDQTLQFVSLTPPCKSREEFFFYKESTFFLLLAHAMKMLMLAGSKLPTLHHFIIKSGVSQT